MQEEIKEEHPYKPASLGALENSQLYYMRRKEISQMAEEKKYEITISDLSAYIGAAAFEILPEDAKEEDVDKYAMVAAGITDRVAKHLDGSDPLPEDHVALAKEMGQFINELGVVCEKIVQAVMEE